MTTEQQKKNRQKARRQRRERERIPGKGAGQPIPIRGAPGQPAVKSLAKLAKGGGSGVPLSIPQLMAKVGALSIERDFWMNAAVSLEEQVNILTGGGTAPSLADLAAAEVAAAEEEEEIQDIPVEAAECPDCKVTLGPEAAHAEGCQFEGKQFDPADEAEEPTKIGANVPAEEKATEGVSQEEEEVLADAREILARQEAAAAGEPQPEAVPPVEEQASTPPLAPPTVEQAEGSEEPASE